jgi:hypothetical protein
MQYLLVCRLQEESKGGCSSSQAVAQKFLERMGWAQASLLCPLRQSVERKCVYTNCDLSASLRILAALLQAGTSPLGAGGVQRS